MQIQKHYSLVHADKVLTLVKKIVKNKPSFKNHPISLEAWSNGREQGYYLVNMNGIKLKNWRGVVFAQQRCSDVIMAVAGPSLKFDVSTNMPSDELWKNEKYFEDDEEAAKFIANFIS